MGKVSIRCIDVEIARTNYCRCATKAVQDQVCKDGIGDDIPSEPGQMYRMHVDEGLVRSDKTCQDIECSKHGWRDNVCDAFGCGGCNEHGRCEGLY